MSDTAWIGLACTLLGAALSYVAFARGKTKDDRADGRETGAVMTELGYIKGSVDRIDRKLDQQEAQTRETLQRLSAVESSAKQAHHRIDRLEGRNE